MSQPTDNEEYLRSFAGLSFEEFRRRAVDPSLSPNEKIGFPRQYRDGITDSLLRDIGGKLPAITEPGTTILDIGSGCGDLAVAMVESANRLKQTLILCDSKEMLSELPDIEHMQKVEGPFPGGCQSTLKTYRERIDAILVYSVVQYVFGHECLHTFVDECLPLLKPGGRCLIGDIPNQSMRNRFFCSAAGIRTHQEFTQTDETPTVEHHASIPGSLDDSVVLSLQTRIRNCGYHAFLVPQDNALPTSNRREDLLIIRP